jgi:pimeloyl-ACP methyl ester carboxylesterase
VTTFLLIPGAGGQAWYWHRVVPELVARGHDGVAVELPSGDDTAGFAEYADAAVAAVKDRTEDLVVVGQSMGAYTGALVATRLPARLLVLLNAMTPRTGETGGEWWGNVGFAEARQAQADRDGRRLDDDPDNIEAFFHDVPADVRADAFTQGEFQQSGTPFAQPWTLPWPDVPTRFLAGRDDRFFPIELQRRVVPERLGVPVDEMPGGHLVALSRPAELADRLVAYASSPARPSSRAEQTDPH